MRFSKQIMFLFFCLVIASVFTFANSYVKGIETLENGDYLIIVPHQVDYKVFELPNPERVVIDLKDTITQAPINLSVQNESVRQIRCAQHSTEPENISRVVFDLELNSPYNVSQDGRGLIVSFQRLVMNEPEVVPIIDKFVDVELADSSVELPKIRLAQETVLPAVTLTEPAIEIEEEVKEYTGEPISMDFKDISVVDVLTFLAEVGEKNIVVHPDVKGNVTLKINDVAWDAVFDIVLRNSDLGKDVQGDVIRVAKMDKLTKEKKEEAELKMQKALAADLVTELIVLNYASAEDVKKIFENFKSKKEGAEIITDRRTNTVIIRDIPEYIEKMKQLIATLDRETQQVAIEARIVETSSDFQRIFGINWASTFSASPVYGNTTKYKFPYTYDTGFITAIPVSGDDTSASAININMGNITGAFNLAATIEALEKIDGARTISAPKIVVQNNEKALIEQGTEFTVVIPGSGAGTGATEKVKAVTKIEVTPTITPDRKISLKIVVSKNEPSDAGIVYGAVSVATKMVESTIVVEDGETAVVGGLFSTQSLKTNNTIPLLGSIPIIKHLFSSEVDIQKNTELLIFITPQIRESY